MSNKRYVYFWMDGVYFNVRMDDARPRSTILALVFRLGLGAEKHWIKLRGFQRLGQMIR